jgi:hypothetical protein
MTKVRGVSGGGYEGRNVTHTRNPKQEPASYQVTPGRTSTIGQSIYGWNKGPIHNGPGYSNPIGPSDSMGQGPGANRVVMRSGSQAHHQGDRPMGRGRDLFK